MPPAPALWTVTIVLANKDSGPAMDKITSRIQEWNAKMLMNVLKASPAVLIQSAKTCRGGTSAAVYMVSLLPLEITGNQESQAISPVLTLMNALKCVSSIQHAPTLLGATFAPATLALHQAMDS